jgi:hypothetical protein
MSKTSKGRRSAPLIPDQLQPLAKRISAVEGWASLIPNMKKVEAQVKNRYLGSRSGSISSVRRRTSVQIGNAPRVKGGEIKVRRSHLNPAKLTKEETESRLAEIAEVKEKLQAALNSSKSSRIARAVPNLVDRCTFVEKKLLTFHARMWSADGE